MTYGIHIRFSWVAVAAIVGAALSSCTPSTSNSNLDAVQPQFTGNISTLYGSSGDQIKISKTEPTLESDFTWKDSVGNLHSLSDYKGKIVLLNFWALWCTYCVQEMPELQDIAVSRASDSVVVIGVTIDHTSNTFKDVSDFVKFEKCSYQMVIDPSQELYGKYSQEDGLPQTFLIDQQGQLRDYFPQAETEKTYNDAIDALL